MCGGGKEFDSINKLYLSVYAFPTTDILQIDEVEQIAWVAARFETWSGNTRMDAGA